ncbi:2Fe-2S iron-sulfur cluster-binding protein [Chelativorans multitrophicus]|jgi:NADH dehydrogenase/NADH:ubiquinone oxidoreductase subunit G|uniref:NAD(FAD)-dependent dehydrogenase n=2 Tax=Chelativorans TaxID=449972 RepID=Q11C68_CHESB
MMNRSQAQKQLQGKSVEAGGTLHRLCVRQSVPVTIYLDGSPIEARTGDSLLAAVMSAAARLRINEFDGSPRGGFCAMGACQDCWIWVEGRQRVRACTTLVEEGMRLSTTATVMGC